VAFFTESAIRFSNFPISPQKIFQKNYPELEIQNSIHNIIPRIEKEGLMERAIILCKLNKSLLKSSISVGIHRQKSLYYLMNLCI
jgi:hypothetical protein